MNNDKNNLAFRVPSFERAEAYNFDSTVESFAVYKELSEIAEEIEKCRLKKYLKPKVYTNRLSYDDLINAESALGRTLFGPIPAGHQREFFAFRKNVWIWYESWKDESGALQKMTVRYEVRPTGVYKRNGSGRYEKIEGPELDNFRLAAYSYLNLVKSKLYC